MAREQGLKRLSVDGVEFEFAEIPVLPTPNAARPKGRPMPTAQDFLLWSTGERLSCEPEEPTAAAKAAMPEAGPGKA
jgi:hypothetical protein